MKGLRIALAVAVLLSAYALGGASAKAASIGPQPFAAARIATARDASALDSEVSRAERMSNTPSVPERTLVQPVAAAMSGRAGGAADCPLL